MRIRPLSAGALILSLMATTAAAEQPRQYFAVHGFEEVASEYEFDLDDDQGADGDLWRLKLGYQFGRFLAAELHYGFDGTGGDEPNLREGAVFGRLQLPYERVNVYALAGAGRVGGDFGEGRETETGPAMGLGIDLFGTERTAVALEYVHYQVGDDDRDYKAVTLGLKHHFDWPSFRSE